MPLYFPFSQQLLLLSSVTLSFYALIFLYLIFIFRRNPHLKAGFLRDHASLRYHASMKSDIFFAIERSDVRHAEINKNGGCHVVQTSCAQFLAPFILQMVLTDRLGQESRTKNYQSGKPTSHVFNANLCC